MKIFSSPHFFASFIYSDQQFPIELKQKDLIEQLPLLTLYTYCSGSTLHQAIQTLLCFNSMQPSTDVLDNMKTIVPQKPL